MELLKKLYRIITCGIKFLYYSMNYNKQYKYVMCKSCNTCIRLPKNKGRLIITCPECGAIFDVNT